MNKPKQQGIKYFDFLQILKYIKEKYEVDTDRYEQWVINEHLFEVRNDSYHELFIDEILNRKATDEYILKITSLIDDEFGEYKREDGELDIYISW